MPGVPGSPEKKDRRSYPFIKLLRRFQDHPLWRQPRVFHDAEAWIDMLFMAYHDSRETVWNTHPIRLEPGEFMASVGILERRWRWSRGRVRRFLRKRELAGEIVLNGPRYKELLKARSMDPPHGPTLRTHPGTHVSICNYAEIHRSAATPRTHPIDPPHGPTTRECSYKRKNGRSAQGKSRPSVTTSRLPSCDRKPGDGVSESEQAAVRLAIREAGFGGE